jgi:hypothetical protein
MDLNPFRAGSCIRRIGQFGGSIGRLGNQIVLLSQRFHFAAVQILGSTVFADRYITHWVEFSIILPPLAPFRSLF